MVGTNDKYKCSSIVAKYFTRVLLSNIIFTEYAW